MVDLRPAEHTCGGFQSQTVVNWAGCRRSRLVLLILKRKSLDRRVTKERWKAECRLGLAVGCSAGPHLGLDQPHSAVSSKMT